MASKDLHKHVLVTGGSGFIGQQLCPQLVKVGWQVSVLTRNASLAGKYLPEVQHFVTDLGSLASSPPVTAIVNLAGEPIFGRRWTEARKRALHDSRVELTESLFNYFGNLGGTFPQVLISGSAVGYYGDQGDRELTEQSPRHPCFSSDLCHQWEAAATKFTDLGTRVCLLRTGVVLDRGGGVLKMLWPLFQLGLGGPVGSGTQWMSWIYRGDLVRLIIYCLDHPEMSGPVNATAPAPVTNSEFSKTLANLLSRPCFLPAPAWAMRGLYGQMADELLLSGQRIVPERALSSGFQFNYGELGPALRACLSQ